MPTASPNTFSDLYSAYASGTLDPAFALMLETQGVMRPDIRGGVMLSEAISGSFLETAPEAALSDGALDRALALIDAMEASPGAYQAAAGKAEGALGELLDLPEPVRDAALEAAGMRGWQRLGLGLKRLKLDISSAMEVELYRIEPGAKILRHTHSGPELTMVLTGGFSDERGNYGPGDVAMNGPKDTHQPVADEDEICFALAIRDGGLRFTGLMGAVQKLLGAR